MTTVTTYDKAGRGVDLLQLKNAAGTEPVNAGPNLSRNRRLKPEQGERSFSPVSPSCRLPLGR